MWRVVISESGTVEGESPSLSWIVNAMVPEWSCGRAEAWQCVGSMSLNLEIYVSFMSMRYLPALLTLVQGNL